LYYIPVKQYRTAISNYSFKILGYSISGKSSTGITAGLLGDIPIGKLFSLQPAVNFVQYGTKIESGSEADGYLERNNLKVNSIEIPLHCLYNAAAGKGRVYFGAGPALSFHLSGKRKSYNSYDGETENKLQFGSDDNADLKSLNIGADFMAGYCFANGFFVAANYNLGLNNLEPGSSADESSKSHYFGIKLGYFINNK
jgi:Outer membrane protein beta-barrel domain